MIKKKENLNFEYCKNVSWYGIFNLKIGTLSHGFKHPYLPNKNKNSPILQIKFENLPSWKKKSTNNKQKRKKKLPFFLFLYKHTCPPCQNKPTKLNTKKKRNPPYFFTFKPPLLSTELHNLLMLFILSQKNNLNFPNLWLPKLSQLTLSPSSSFLPLLSTLFFNQNPPYIYTYLFF